MSKIYKTPEAKSRIMGLYDQKLKSLNINYEELDIPTSFGRTRIVKTGNPAGKPIVLFHGFNAGAPLTLEAVLGLLDAYQFYGVDTIGQTTKSEENRLNSKDLSYGKWAAEVVKGLALEKANFIGISYGAYILQKMIRHQPDLVGKAIFVVPSGLVSGPIGPSITQLTIPLLAFKITKKEKHMKKFLSAFVPDDDAFMQSLLAEMMNGTYLDTSIPKLLKEKDVANFQAPVYVIGADNDVYFPGQKTIDRCKVLFPNFKEGVLLKDSKHMPGKNDFGLIQEKIKGWIG
jgi:pimeloyl-ACP methyl ester carboxylesterase